MPRRYVNPPQHATVTRYAVLWDLQWRILECVSITAGTDLAGSMRAAISRLERAGWRIEGEPDYGFVFVQRADERCLLMITARNPGETGRQTFSPFQS
jgi:hypothetical protein